MSNLKEEILVIPRACLLGSHKAILPNLSRLAFTDLLNTHGVFMVREDAETNENFLQLIPYVVLRHKDEVFMYKRLKAGSEKRLHDKYSIGIGGHIERDLGTIPGSTLDTPRNHFIKSTSRELFEEVILNADPILIESENRYLIYDDSNAVGRVHLGILIECRLGNIDADAKSIVEVRETHKLEGSMVKIDYIRNSPDLVLENWSKKALECISTT